MYFQFVRNAVPSAGRTHYKFARVFPSVVLAHFCEFLQILEGVTNRIPSAISVMVKFRSFLILFMFGTFSFFSLFAFRVISFKCCFCDFTFCFCELLSFSENLTNFVISCEMNFMIFATKSFSRKSHAARQLCTAQPALAAQSEKPAQSAKHGKEACTTKASAMLYRVGRSAWLPPPYLWSWYLYLSLSAAQAFS